MEAFQTACRIVVLICCLTYEGIFVQLTYAEVNNFIIHESNATSAVFECNTRLIVRCYGHRDAFVTWQINNTVSFSTGLAANCKRGSCIVYNNFTGRYSFDYNSSTGISDLTIAPVTLQDNSMEYKCSDGNPQPLKALVKNVFGNHSVSLYNETSTERKITTFKLNVNCTAENITIEWFSTAIDGTDLQFHEATSYYESECIEGICVLHDNSKNRSSWLELLEESRNNRRRKRAAENGRLFGYTILSDSFNVSLPIQGTYRLKETYNVTTPSINNTTLSTNNITTSTGISKTFLPVIIGSVCGFLVFLIIIIVIAVCYVQRKKTKEQQPKEHYNPMYTQRKTNDKK